MNLDKLLRAIVMVIIFEAAYIAEVSAVACRPFPRASNEAAAAMGLGYWRTMGLVILPQALKLVIPGIVNTFIALFKDSSLVIIIGLFDLLNSIKRATSDPAGWACPQRLCVRRADLLGFCFAMSSYSARLERKLNTGHKR